MDQSAGATALLRLVRRATGWPEAAVELREHLLPTSPALPVAVTGAPLHLEDARADAALGANPWVDGRLGTTGALSAVPVSGPDGELLAVLVARDARPHPRDAAREAALADLAALAAATLVSDRRARREAQLAAAVAESDALVALAHGELAARHDLLEAVLETVDVGIVAVDAAGRATVVNPVVRAWCSMPEGGPPEAAAARATALLAGAQDGPLAAARELLGGVLAGGVTTTAAVSWTSVDGHRVDALCRARALHDDSGAVTGAVLRLTDVTAERAATTALAAAVAELERSNGELAAFAAVAGHDLRSPLTVVEGYLELLADDAEERGAALAARWAATARASTGRMASLIDALLGYARAGAAPLQRSAVPVADVVAAVVADLGPAPGARVQGPDPAAVVDADPVQLRQLLQNLVSNALKFTAPGQDARVECAVTATGDGWEIVVADHGPGVPPERREAVFRVFERAGAAGAAAVAGHGIGLATAQRVTARHGGTIALEETPGGGATVRVRLPRAGAGAGASGAAATTVVPATRVVRAAAESRAGA